MYGELLETVCDHDRIDVVDRLIQKLTHANARFVLYLVLSCGERGLSIDRFVEYICAHDTYMDCYDAHEFEQLYEFATARIVVMNIDKLRYIPSKPINIKEYIYEATKFGAERPTAHGGLLFLIKFYEIFDGVIIHKLFRYILLTLDNPEDIRKCISLNRLLALNIIYMYRDIVDQNKFETLSRTFFSDSDETPVDETPTDVTAFTAKALFIGTGIKK